MNKFIFTVFFICLNLQTIFAFNQNENRTFEKEISRKKRDDCSDQAKAQITENSLKLLALTAAAVAQRNPLAAIEFASQVAAVAGSAFGFKAVTTCDIMVKLEEILSKIKEISDKIDVLTTVVECVVLKESYKTIKKNLARLLNSFIEHAKEKTVASLKSVVSRCNDNSEGIDKILSLFQSFFFDENEMRDVFKNCGHYRSKDSTDWMGNMQRVFKSITTLIMLCSDVNGDYTFKNRLKAFEKDYNSFVTYYVKQLIPETFVNDQSSTGVRESVKKIANKESSAETLANTLKEKYDYFDWTVILYPDSINGDDNHQIYQSSQSFASGSLFFMRQLETKKNALIGWHLSRAERPSNKINFFETSIQEKNPRANGISDKVFKDNQHMNYVISIKQHVSTTMHSPERKPDLIESSEINAYGLYNRKLIPGYTYQTSLAGMSFRNYAIMVYACQHTIASKEEKPKINKYSIFFDNTALIEKSLLTGIKNDGSITRENMNVGFDRITSGQTEINNAIAGVDELVRIESKETRNVLNSGFSHLSTGQNLIRADLKTGFDSVLSGQSQIRLDIATVGNTVKTEHAQTRKEMHQGFNELKSGQSLIRQENKEEHIKTRQELRQGFGELKTGQIEIKQSVKEVREDLKMYGERGIQERAQILTNVRHYGEVGIEQRIQIIKDLSGLRSDVGDIRTTQLEENYKSSMRFDYLKNSLHTIHGTIIDEAIKSETRHNIVAGGINDLKSMHITEANNNQIRFNIITSGIDDVKNHLGIESQKSAERFGVLNYGVERIMNHNLIESQINEQRFVTLNNGVNDIRNIQIEESKLSTKRFEFLANQADTNFRIIGNGITDIRQAQVEDSRISQLNQMQIMENQKIESIIGTQRFENIKGDLSKMFNILAEEGFKTEEIINLIVDEKNKNKQRFAWISENIFDQNDKLKSIENKQDVALYLLSEVMKNIEIKSNMMSVSHGRLFNEISSLERNVNTNHNTLLFILSDIKRDLAILASKLNFENTLEINTYLNSIAEIRVIRDSFVAFLELNSTFYHEELTEACQKSSPTLKKLLNLFDAKSIIRPTRLVESLVSMAKYSVNTFNKAMKEVLKDINEAYLIHLICLQNRLKNPIKETDLKIETKRSDVDISNIFNILTTSKFNMATNFNEDKVRDVVKEFVLKTKLRNNHELAKSLFNYLTVNYNWYKWSVTIFDNINHRYHEIFVNNCKNCEYLFTGGGFHMEEVFERTTKHIIVLWKPAVTANYKENLLNSQKWNALYKSLEGVKADRNLIIESIKSELTKQKIKFCSIFSIEKLNKSDNYHSRSDMFSLDSRIFKFESSSSMQILEIFIDLNSCEQGRIVNSNTNINTNYKGYSFLSTMPCFELSINEPDVATEIISSTLTNYFKNLWTVLIVNRADETFTQLNLKSTEDIIHIKWYSFDIILTSNVISVDSSISTINNVGIIPSLFTISGRGTCVIDEGNSFLKNYAALNFTNTLFYVQCAGPTLITINLPEIKTDIQDQKDVSFQRKKRESNIRIGSKKKNGVRLFIHYAAKKVSFETECFQWCLSEEKCVASTLSLPLDYHYYCFLFTNEYMAKVESDWISEFKIDPENRITLFDYSRSTVRLHERSFGSSIDIYPIDQVCQELPKQWFDRVESIRTNGNCIVLFSRKDCTSGVQPVRFEKDEPAVILTQDNVKVQQTNFGSSWINRNFRAYTACQGFNLIADKYSQNLMLDSNLQGNVFFNFVGNSGTFQVWELEPRADSYILLRNKATGRYLRSEIYFGENILSAEYYRSNDDNIVWEIAFQENDYLLKNKANNEVIEFKKLEKITNNIQTTERSTTSTTTTSTSTSTTSTTTTTTSTTTTTTITTTSTNTSTTTSISQKKGKKRNFKMVFNVKHYNNWFQVLDTANEFDCLEQCQLVESCEGSSTSKINATTFHCSLHKKGFTSEYSLNSISFIEIVSESTIISTVEYTTFKETHVAKVLASSICYELSQRNNSLSSFVRQLDENLVDTNGWSIISFSKLSNVYSSWNLNTIQNLFLFGTCTATLRDLKEGRDSSKESIETNNKALKTASFVLFYSPEKNCIQNNTDWMNPAEKPNAASVENYKELNSITQVLSLDSFQNEYLEFQSYKIHRSTNIASPFHLSYLIKSLQSVITKKQSKLFLAEEIKKKVGQYWNVLVNPIGLISQVSLVFDKNTFLRIQMSGYDIMMFHTPLNKCY